jgi:hypothetical protein
VQKNSCMKRHKKNRERCTPFQICRLQ